MSQVLIVTGGSRGIGAAVAVAAAKAGYDVCVNYHRDQAAAGRVVDDIKRTGRSAIAVHADMAAEADVKRMFRTVDQDLGTVSALINNAGMLPPGGRVDTMNAERINRVFALNVTGAFLCAREAILRMSTRHDGTGGTIVNVSSAAARLGAADEFVDYAASKGAIDSLTIGLAREVAEEKIRVVGVRPGVIDTELHASSGDPERMQRLRDVIPLKRIGQPDEVAALVMWLISDAASYVTGTTIDVTGGR